MFLTHSLLYSLLVHYICPRWGRSATGKEKNSLLFVYHSHTNFLSTVCHLPLLHINPFFLNSGCRRSVLPPAGYVMNDCVHRCPELDACINSSLWCDGVDHCPSGYDEAAKHCSFILQLPLLYLALGAAGILVICCSLFLITCSACRERRRSKHHSRIMSLPSDTSTFGKEVIC